VGDAHLHAGRSAIHRNHDTPSFTSGDDLPSQALERAFLNDNVVALLIGVGSWPAAHVHTRMLWNSWLVARAVNGFTGSSQDESP
jgi:hypothetical protein